jgi:hypothetical protein
MFALTAFNTVDICAVLHNNSKRNGFDYTILRTGRLCAEVIVMIH